MEILRYQFSVLSEDVRCILPLAWQKKLQENTLWGYWRTTSSHWTWSGSMVSIMRYPLSWDCPGHRLERRSSTQQGHIVGIYPQREAGSAHDYALVEESRIFASRFGECVVKVICEKGRELWIFPCLKRTWASRVYLENQSRQPWIWTISFIVSFSIWENKMQCYHWMMTEWPCISIGVRSMSLTPSRTSKT